MDNKPPDKSTSLESRLLNFIDSNIRKIQYSIYFLGVAGLAVISRSTFIFRKFSSSPAVPKEFITNGYRLQGKVLDIHPIVVTDMNKAYNIVQFQIEHIPICSVPWRKCSSLNIEMAGVWATSQGIDTIKNLVTNKSVWIRLYGSSENSDIIYSSIHTKWSWRVWRQRDMALQLLKLNQGLVASFPAHHLQFNKYYSAYYRKLLQHEAKYRKSI